MGLVWNFSRGGNFSNNFRWRNSDSRAIHPSDTPNRTNHTVMKLILSALCASFVIAPLSFANSSKDLKEETILASDCGKCKKDGEEKKEEGTLASDCGKCKKDGEEKKEEGTLAGACGKCKKDGEEKKEEGTLADCGKCKKDGDKEEEKKEGTLA